MQNLQQIQNTYPFNAQPNSPVTLTAGTVQLPHLTHVTQQGLDFCIIGNAKITLAQLPKNYQNLSVYNFIKAITLIKSGCLSSKHGKRAVSMAEIMAGFGCMGLKITPALQAAKWLQNQPPKKLLQFLNINCCFNTIGLTHLYAPEFFNLYILVNHASF